MLSTFSMMDLLTEPALIVSVLFALVFLVIILGGVFLLIRGIQQQKVYNTTTLPSLEEEESEEEPEEEQSAFDMEALPEDYGESDSESLLAELHAGHSWHSARNESDNKKGDGETEIDADDYSSSDDSQFTKIAPTRFKKRRKTEDKDDNTSLPDF